LTVHISMFIVVMVVWSKGEYLIAGKVCDILTSLELTDESGDSDVNHISLCLLTF